ncbi:MAG: hypothetical protein N4A74_22265 [Carboxylicivirga sp.]|nr:hypothetical protein [Carboxylicivirga sp.]
MNKIHILLICTLFPLLHVSCYEEEILNVEPGKPLYEVKDSDDPLDHQIYDLYKRFNTIIRYDFDDQEVKYNVVKSLTADDISGIVELQEDKAILLDGVEFVEQIFLTTYSGLIDNSWLPFKILLAKKINEENEWVGLRENLDAYAGINILVVGNITSDLKELSSAQIKKAKEAIHGNFWGVYLFKNERIQIPESFFEVSDGKYGDSTDDPNAEGFWYINDVFEVWGNYGPDRDMDVRQFFGKIITTPYEDLKEILEANPKLKTKYTILVNHMKSEYDLDIQAIGDAN